MPCPWLTEASTHLTLRLRQVVQLVDVEGITYDEAAAVLGIPSGTLMSRLHRARHQMRARPARHPEFRSQP